MEFELISTGNFDDATIYLDRTLITTFDEAVFSQMLAESSVEINVHNSKKSNKISKRFQKEFNNNFKNIHKFQKKKNQQKSKKNIPKFFAVFCHFLSFSFPLWTDPIPCDCDLAWIVRDNRQFFPRVFGNCLSVDGNKTWFNNDAQVQLLTDDLESCWLSLHFVPFFVPFRTHIFVNVNVDCVILNVRSISRPGWQI